MPERDMLVWDGSSYEMRTTTYTGRRLTHYRGRLLETYSREELIDICRELWSISNRNTLA